MRAVLDACVLYPTLLRDLLLGAAAARVFEPVWSVRILEEWARAAARSGPVTELGTRGEIARLRARWPEAEGVASAMPSASLPDPDDQHVFDLAIGIGAPVIVTANLRDFPAHLLRPLGVTAVHPDAFLLERHAEAPGPVEAAARAAVAEAAASLRIRADTRALLKRAGLPRLAKRLAPR